VRQASAQSKNIAPSPASRRPVFCLGLIENLPFHRFITVKTGSVAANPRDRATIGAQNPLALTARRQPAYMRPPER
jgi:hypothetical protein